MHMFSRCCLFFVIFLISPVLILSVDTTKRDLNNTTKQASLSKTNITTLTNHNSAFHDTSNTNTSKYLKSKSSLSQTPPLECYATLAPPTSQNNEKRIICPESRSNYCIKEVTQITRRSECGITKEYPWDEWDIKLGQCVYRKCSSTCPMEEPYHDHDDESYNDTLIESSNDDDGYLPSAIKTYMGEDGTRYEREIFCCRGSLCNSGRNMRVPSSLFCWISLGVLIALILSMVE